MDNLLKNMILQKGVKNFTIYFDLETLTFNKDEGKKQPSKYKNIVYAVGVGCYNQKLKIIEKEIYPNFLDFFEKFFEYQKRSDTIGVTTTITLIAHNTNKYDNHFLLHDLEYYYNIERVNLFLNNANNDGNLNSEKKKNFKKSQNVIFEKRVKSSINLELSFNLNNTKFNVIDNLMKTNASISTLGKKLLKLNLLTSDDLKTDYNYTEFDVNEDLTDTQAINYAFQVYKSLTKKQKKYIENDITILGLSHVHYSKIFPNYNYTKPTFTSNILESYLNNELTRFQLLNKKDRNQISLSDYQFADENYYNFIKSFYRGGLNFYNDNYIGKIINEDCFSIDENSAYPYTMHNKKIPTFLCDYKHSNEQYNINFNVNDDNYFYLFRMSKITFNIDILSKIESKLIRQILVKYYANDTNFVNISSETIKFINEVCKLDISSLDIFSFVKYECYYFGARDIIEDYYFIKTQGKQKNKVIMENPYKYEITNVLNDNVYTNEEIDLAKVQLNGLYGIPALRSHFNLFRISEDKQEIYNVHNGYKNTERNLLFSVFVTSNSFYNLLNPLKYLSQKEIDENLIYTDTDSLYLKKKIFNKLPKKIFDKISLGAWDIENETITNFFVLNHKKYCYTTPDNKIKIRSAGIPKESFNTDMNFKEFVNTQFTHGCKIKNNKSIYTKFGTICIYESETEIKQGTPYPDRFSKLNDEKIKLLKEKIFNEIDYSNLDDVLYIESDLGSFSYNDLKPFVFENTYLTEDLHILKRLHFMLKHQLKPYLKSN